MKEAKEKDLILAQIGAFTPHQEITGLDRHLPELESSGLVKVRRDMQGDVILVRLTNKGKDFLKGDSYATMRKAQRKAAAYRLAKNAFSWLMGIAATVISAWITWKLFGTT